MREFWNNTILSALGTNKSRLLTSGIALTSLGIGGMTARNLPTMSTPVNNSSVSSPLIYFDDPETIHSVANFSPVDVGNGNFGLMAHHKNATGHDIDYFLKFSEPVNLRYGIGKDQFEDIAGSKSAKSFFESKSQQLTELNVHVPRNQSFDLLIQGSSSKPFQISAGFDASNPNNIFKNGQIIVDRSGGIKSYSIDLSTLTNPFSLDLSGRTESQLGYGQNITNKIPGVLEAEIPGHFGSVVNINLHNPYNKAFTLSLDSKNLAGKTGYWYNLGDKLVKDLPESLTLSPNSTKTIQFFKQGGIDSDFKFFCSLGKGQKLPQLPTSFPVFEDSALGLGALLAGLGLKSKKGKSLGSNIEPVTRQWYPITIQSAKEETQRINVDTIQQVQEQHTPVTPEAIQVSRVKRTHLNRAKRIKERKRASTINSRKKSLEDLFEDFDQKLKIEERNIVEDKRTLESIKTDLSSLEKTALPEKAKKTETTISRAALTESVPTITPELTQVAAKEVEETVSKSLGHVGIIGGVIGAGGLLYLISHHKRRLEPLNRKVKRVQEHPGSVHKHRSNVVEGTALSAGTAGMFFSGKLFNPGLRRNVFFTSLLAESLLSNQNRVDAGSSILTSAAATSVGYIAYARSKNQIGRGLASVVRNIQSGKDGTVERITKQLMTAKKTSKFWDSFLTKETAGYAVALAAVPIANSVIRKTLGIFHRRNKLPQHEILGSLTSNNAGRTDGKVPVGETASFTGLMPANIRFSGSLNTHYDTGLALNQFLNS